MNEAVLAAMKDSGCYEVVYGIESGSQKVLDALGKGTTVEQNARAIDLTKKAGIKVKTAVIVGSPGETWETIEQTVKLITEHRPDKAIVCAFTPYPGSPAWDDPEKFKLKILSRDVSTYQVVGPDMCGRVMVETEQMKKEDLEKAHDYVLGKFRRMNLI